MQREIDLCDVDVYDSLREESTALAVYIDKEDQENEEREKKEIKSLWQSGECYVQQGNNNYAINTSGRFNYLNWPWSDGQSVFSATNDTFQVWFKYIFQQRFLGNFFFKYLILFTNKIIFQIYI